MSEPFLTTPSLTGLHKPLRVELDVRGLEVLGRLPADLEGVMYRVTPDPAWPSMVKEDVGWNGDGMVSMYTFRNGDVDLRTRYVRTAKFIAESEARRGLFGFYRNPFTDDRSVAGMDRGTANTNIVWHGGRLLALKEDSVPYELDPDTLDTKARFTWGGKLKSRNFTAHPKIDPQSGELWAFGYESTAEASADASLIVINRDGELIREELFQTPFASMMHDFAVTREHVIFICPPVIADIERMKRGGSHFAWHGDKPTWVGIMPRKGSVADLRWFKGPACGFSHIFNAYTEGQRVVVDLPMGNKIYYPLYPDALTEMPLTYDDLKGPYMARWTFNLASSRDAFEQQPLIDPSFTGEMPRIDDRFAMSPDYHLGFIYLDDKSQPCAGRKYFHLAANSLARIDFRTGKIDLWYLGEYAAPQEVQFVPRENSAREGDGYLLTISTDVRTEQSVVLVHDAEHLSDGPLATVLLPIRARMSFHGNWVSASTRSGWNSQSV